MDAGQGARSPFAGRDREVALLREAIAAAREGAGGMVLISGPAGIGKSRLAEEAVAGEPGVVWGRCPDEEGVPPLWPWTRILERLHPLPPTESPIGPPAGSAAPPSTLTAADPPAAPPSTATAAGPSAGPPAESSAVPPPTATAAGSSDGPLAESVVAADASEAGAARFRLLVSLADALFAAAEDAKGLVVVIEDVHDADEASLALLRQVASEAAGSRLLVLATHRHPGPGDGGGGLAATLAEITRGRAVRSLALAPLTAADVARILAGVPDGAALASAVHERTGGLPLLVSAMARALERAPRPAAGSLPGGGAIEDGLMPPADLRMLVLGMLGGLDAEVRRTAGVAAVLGQEIDVRLLAAVRGLPHAVVSGHLDRLTVSGVLTTGMAPAPVPLPGTRTGHEAAAPVARGQAVPVTRGRAAPVAHGWAAPAAYEEGTPGHRAHEPGTTRHPADEPGALGHRADESGALGHRADESGALGHRADEPGQYDPGRPSMFRFAHALVREGVAAATARDAADLHKSAAMALERWAGGDPAQAARIAAHWQRAGDDAGTLRTAVRWTRAAAAYALRSAAPEEAARLARQALDLLGRAGAGPVRRAEALIESATAECYAGFVGQSAGRCREAAEAAEAAGRADLLASAALVVGGAGDRAVVVAMAALCDRALAAMDAAPATPAADACTGAGAGRGWAGEASAVVIRSRLLARKASWEVEADRWEEAARTSAEALRLAEDCGDPAALLDAVRARAGILDRPGDVAERRRLGELAVGIALRAGRPMSAVRGHIWRLDAAYQVGDLAAVDDGIARLGELAAATRLPVAGWYHRRAAAARAALAGRWDDARTLSAEAGTLAVRTGDSLACVVTDVFAQLLALVRGDRRELPDGHRGSFATPPTNAANAANAANMANAANAANAANMANAAIPVIEAAYALRLHLDGARDEALARYERLRLSLRGPLPGARGMGVLQHVTELVEAFDDAEAAQWAHEHWLPWAAAAGVPGGADSFCGGSSARAVGRMAAVMGRLDEAEGALRAAAEVNLLLDARPWLVHTWLPLAEVLLRRGAPGDHEEAAALAERAAAEARRLDLPGPLARADRLLAATAARRRADDPLTAREREVAGLVAQALSNRRIADRLTLSERTVESHVRNILTKLGLANRAELIARLLGERQRHPRPPAT
ncbi:AAA family ATPase [Sphaerisporangium dianthi]|uniref:AAA family ATPase n=1 Tax=Sphaerisporangium dianthi TaxID=1436120 RepID=A0ABV9C951_9ACTN